MSSIAPIVDAPVFTKVPPRVLVICYSRTGSTRVVGQALAAALGADFEELRLVDAGSEPRSFARCGLDVLFRRRVRFAPLAHNVADYAALIIGTPVWMASVSSPVRTFLLQTRPLATPVAVFVTHGDSTVREHVFEQLQTLIGHQPIARAAFPERKVVGRDFDAALLEFAAEIRDRIPGMALRR